jgi:molybdopterin/thiamine biosynthesis adenylyltransferase
LVIDEIDFGLFRESVLLQRAARQRGTYYLFTSAIGFGALVAIFDPEGFTLEEYDKLPPNVDLNNIKKSMVALDRISPIIPSYAASFPPDTINKIYAGEMPGPTTSIGVGLASLLAANEAINIILKRRDIPTAPKYTYIDLVDRRFIVGTVM